MIGMTRLSGDALVEGYCVEQRMAVTFARRRKQGSLLIVTARINVHLDHTRFDKILALSI